MLPDVRFVHFAFEAGLERMQRQLDGLCRRPALPRMSRQHLLRDADPIEL